MRLEGVSLHGQAMRFLPLKFWLLDRPVWVGFSPLRALVTIGQQQPLYVTTIQNFSRWSSFIDSYMDSTLHPRYGSITIASLHY